MTAHRYTLVSYCPRCGQRYRPSDFNPAAVMFRCGGCDFDFYQNSVPSATAVVPSAEDPSRILLLARRTPPHEGRWALPGGILAYGEDPAQAAVRETAEETTLRVRVQRLLCATGVEYSYRGRLVSMLELAFLMHPVAPSVAGIETPEALRLSFVDVEEAAQSGALAFPEQAAVLRAYAQSIVTTPIR